MTAAKAGTRARFGLTLGLVVALAAVGNAAINLLIPAPLYVFVALLLALLAVLVAVRVGGCSTRDLGLDREQLGHGLRLGAAVAAVLGVVLAVGAALPATRDLFADRRVDQQSVTLLLYHTLVRIPLGTAVAEETLFRGSLFGLLLERHAPGRAATLSSVLFGLWHVLPTLDTMRLNAAGAAVRDDPARTRVAVAASVAVTAVAGLGLSWLRFAGGSLVAPTVVHAALNSSAFAAARLVGRSTRR